MTFQQLQYLLAIHRTGSVSQAARELFVTQSSVSIALTSLESELNCRIFVRSTQGLTLTPEGRQVIGHAQRICESHRLLTDSVKPTRSQLRIGAIEFSAARHAFMQLLEENRDRTDIDFSYTGIAGYTSRLLRGDIDLAVNLSFSQYDDRTLDDAKKQKLTCRKLTSIPASICIGKKHRLFDKPDLRPEDFAGECLLDVAGHPISRSGLLLAYVPIDQDRVLVSNNYHLSQQLKREGYAYTITHLRESKEQEPDFRYIPIPGLRYSLFVYNDSVRSLSPEAQRYLEFLEQAVRSTEP